ncbi:hypothetical protein HanRHA438_Chr09g0408941 [Helianthus annuus]|nr:hypothetical protein HanIR_Chr09g0428131 [Helianthus annuus]KAJ0889072.1 hypothetical protein HanRHA438_Chr09g0408941 [Helianthus annuus]
MGSNEGNDQKKPGDKAAGLHNSAELGSVDVGLVEFPPLRAAGPQNRLVGSDKIVTGPLKAANSPDVGLVNPSMHDQLLKYDGPILETVMGQTVKSKGSGYFDVSKQAFGPGPSSNISTKNSFGKLRDEEECYDTDLGMWEHEIEAVKKFVETSTRPKIEDYNVWSENMRKYYDSLTKLNGDEAEVESETDEMARFMKLGSKF